MKNCDEAEFANIERAMEITPRLCESKLRTPLLMNSPLMVSLLPPVPVPVGSPPCTINPAITRWKIKPL